MEKVPEKWGSVRGRLMVSCQAWEDDPFFGPENMARFARAAVEGGAAGIRANGVDDIRAIRDAVDVPILGIQKRVMPDGGILITPTVDDAAQLVVNGADAVALDCTVRGRSHGALERLRSIKDDLGVPVAADIATVEEAVTAAAAGADFVLSTMRGYTAETAHVSGFEPRFISQLVAAVSVPVIAEGRIWTREEARAALSCGALAVIVGSAVTRPRDVASRFSSAIRTWNPATQVCVPAIDLGGTSIKSGLVSAQGELCAECPVPTNVSGGRVGVLEQLIDMGRSLMQAARAGGCEPAALGLAMAGWVDSKTGRVVYGTANLPDWTGAPVAETLGRALNIQVFVENDANAAAVAEKRFGIAREAENFLSITLGTGVGAGCYLGGDLQRGAHSMANALGHLIIEPNGLPCTCGRNGCLEQYANSAALLRYAGSSRYSSAAELIAAAHQSHEGAREAIRKLAGFLARGCALAVQLLDPELIVLSGGLAQENSLLVADLEAALAELVPLWAERRIMIRRSSLGYFGGVFGAAAVALDGIS